MLPLEVSDQSHPSQPSLSTGDVALAGPFSGGGSVFRYLPVEIDTKLGPTTIQNRTCDTTDDETLARGPFDTVPGLAFLTYWCQWMFPASSPTTSDNDDHNDSAIKGDETELQMPPSSTSSTAAATVPLEAYGLAVDAYARATIGMSSIFLGPALLQLAATAAGCPLADTDDNNDQDEGDVYEECTNTIHGFRPSSLLTNLAAVAGVVGCLAVPFIGSMVDHTAFRRELGAATAALLIVVKALELVISAHTWEFVAVLQIVSALLFTSHITASYAYISELSAVPNEQASYNTTFFIILYASTLIFMIQVLLVAALWEKFTNGSNNDTDHDITTARISQSITVLTCAPCFAYAWTHLFRPRPAKHAIPPHQTLLSAGYRQLFGTVRTLYHHNPALTRLLWAVSLSEAASGALIAVSTTYMKSVLRMNSNEIGVVFMAVLLSGFPGSKLGCWLTTRLGNPVQSVILCNAFFIASTSLAAWVLRGPNDKHLAVIFGILWGSALGWLQPQHTTAYVPIIPRGQEAELMGIYLFSGQFLSWLPPTVFTVMNELQIPMSYGLGSLSVFFALALLVLSRMGRYEDAIAAAATTTAFCLPFSHGKVADNGNTNNDTTTFNNENDGLMEQEMSCNYKMVTTPPKANGIHIQQPVHKHEFT